VFENRALRRIFRPKRDKVKGVWRKLHNQELHAVFSLSNINRITTSRNINREEGNACGIMVEKPEVKRPLGRPRRRWVNSINIDLRETGWGGRNWIDLAQDMDQWRAVLNKVMTFSFIKLWKILERLHNRLFLKKG
jgi:hypothetical protein